VQDPSYLIHEEPKSISIALNGSSLLKLENSYFEMSIKVFKIHIKSMTDSVKKVAYQLRPFVCLLFW